MNAIVLVAGVARRLAPLTDTTHKALLRVGGRPVLARMLDALAGAGIRGGTVHGATDELGFHVVEHPHYVTDLHATLLHLLGLDPRRLDVPGRKRLEVDYGRPIRAIMA